MKGFKLDEGKVPLHLLSPVAIEQLGKVLAYGATKYAPNQWRGGMAWSRMLGALLRHTFAFMKGEDMDSESGLPHLAHAMCCAMMALEYQMLKNGTDDRYKAPLESAHAIQATGARRVDSQAPAEEVREASR